MRAIISCISDCKRGKPITDTRHYALVQIANKELILHQVEALKGFDILVLVRDNDDFLQDFLEEHGINYMAKDGFKTVLEKDMLLIPGDVLIKKPKSTGVVTLITTEQGSEEEEALNVLLKLSGFDGAKVWDVDLLTQQVEAQRLNYPWEFLTVNTALLKDIKKKIDKSVTIEDNVTIKGEVIIEKGTIIKAGSYIEGPVIIGADCTIGPMAHIRPDTSVGEKCTIGKTEVYDSIIMEGTVSKHHAYLGHSVLGEDVNVGAFTVTADYRHDGKEHMVHVMGEKVQSKRRKVGAFIGDHARLAINTSIYPGRKISANGTTLPGEVIKEDR